MGLPRRPPLTATGARKTPLKSFLDRVDRFMTRHPEVTITPPYDTFSGLWEVRTKDGVAAWDNGRTMMDDLEKRHGHG
jgi:hypothetical protein